MLFLFGNGPEEQLVDRAVSGDAEAFTQLMEENQGMLYALALRVTGNREDAQDCLQEAMLRIYRSIRSFRGGSSFGTWAYRVTMNTCLDELRRRKLRTVTSVDLLLEEGWEPRDTDAGPEERYLRKQRSARISDAIAQLPEDMRIAIVLRDIQGHSYEEIAQLLDVREGTVKSRISRGREKLRAILEEERELFELADVKRADVGLAGD